MKEYKVRYTSAPEAYDGFGTHTTDTEVAVDHRGRVLRKAAIDPEHLNWQSMRYSSGLYACLSEEQLDEAVRHGIYELRQADPDLQVKTERSRAFDRGNYAAAYESEVCRVPVEYDEHERAGYILGFYSSFELREIGNTDHREEVRALREAEAAETQEVVSPASH